MVNKMSKMSRAMIAVCAIVAFLIGIVAAFRGRWEIATYSMVWAAMWDLRLAILQTEDRIEK